MRKEQEVLLHILSRVMSGGKIPELHLNEGEWQALFKCAEEHEILPLVYDSVCECESLTAVPKEERDKWQSRALSVSIRQIVQTKEFLTLLVHARKEELDPVVIKGIVCRSLYPQPCLRPSVDEDLLILPEEIEKYHGFLLADGLFADKEEYTEADRKAAAELSYHKKDSPTYIELHKFLFDPESEPFGVFNTFFKDVSSRTVRVQIEDVSVRTLAPTDHVLYLILHAYKHFLYGGIGIRPLGDIGLYAKTYAPQIEWEAVRSNLESVHAFYFARALLRIVQLYLLPVEEFFSYIDAWNLSEIDVDALLEDCLESGLHGTTSLSRLHSSSMTLHAARRQSGKGKERYTQAVLRSVFPPLRYMKERYPYLKRSPFLLPVAWMQRGAHYFVETGKKRSGPKADNSVAESIRLGRERIALLRQYRIIE